MPPTRPSEEADTPHIIYKRKETNMLLCWFTWYYIFSSPSPRSQEPTQEISLAKIQKSLYITKPPPLIFPAKNCPLNQFNRSDRPSLPTAYLLYKHPLKFNHSQLFTIIHAKRFVFNALTPLFKLFTLGGYSPAEKFVRRKNGTVE